MIASGLILIISFVTLLIFTISTVLLYLKYPKSRSVKLLLLYSLFFFIGFIFTSLRNKIPNFLSLELGILAFAVGYLFLYMGFKNMLGLESKWHNRYYIPLALLFIGLFLFTDVYYDLHMRIVIFSLYVSTYAFATAWLFYEASAKSYKTFHQFIALFYILTSFIFVLRAINSISLGYNLEVLYSSEFILKSPYFLFIIMTCILIIMSNIYIRKDKRL